MDINTQPDVFERGMKIWTGYPKKWKKGLAGKGNGSHLDKKQWQPSTPALCLSSFATHRIARKQFHINLPRKQSLRSEQDGLNSMKSHSASRSLSHNSGAIKLLHFMWRGVVAHRKECNEPRHHSANHPIAPPTSLFQSTEHQTNAYRTLSVENKCWWLNIQITTTKTRNFSLSPHIHSERCFSNCHLKKECFLYFSCIPKRLKNITDHHMFFLQTTLVLSWRLLGCLRLLQERHQRELHWVRWPEIAGTQQGIHGNPWGKKTGGNLNPLGISSSNSKIDHVKWFFWEESSY